MHVDAALGLEWLKSNASWLEAESYGGARELNAREIKTSSTPYLSLGARLHPDLALEACRKNGCLSSRPAARLGNGLRPCRV